MDDLWRAGLWRPGSRTNLLSNRLVVVVSVSSDGSPRNPSDLRAVPRIAMGDPATVPAGTYARQWLSAIGVWDDVRDHVLPTLDVRAALAAVEQGHAQAGIVYRTDALISKRVRIAFLAGLE